MFLRSNCNLKEFKKIIFGMTVILFFAACTAAFCEQKPAASSAPEDYVVAVLGSEKVYFSQMEKLSQGLNRFLKENFDTSKDWQLDFIRQNIARMALAKRAQKEGKEKDADVVFAIQQARTNILSDKMIMDRLAKINITLDDVKKYYQENIAKYLAPEKVKVSYVKFKNKKDADNVYAQLNKGKGFDALTGKKKIKVNDWMTKDGGGMMVAGLENMTPEARNGLLAMGVGASSSVVEVKSGEVPEYFIFHVDEKEPAKEQPYEEIKSRVEFDYNQEIQSQTVNDVIMETFAQEGVEIYTDKIIQNFGVRNK